MVTEHNLTFTLLSDDADRVVRVKRSWGYEIVYRFPRSAWKEAVKELKHGCVYFLLGEKNGQTNLYVGQSTRMNVRFRQHVNDSSKDFWAETLVLTTEHESLNTAHLHYLENRFHSMALEAGRCQMVNASEPHRGTGVEAFRRDMELRIEGARIMLNLMGYHFLESPAAEVPERRETPLPVQKKRSPKARRGAGDMPPQQADAAPQSGDEGARPALLPGAEDGHADDDGRAEVVPAPLRGPRHRRPQYDFYEMGLKDGDVLVYEDNEAGQHIEVSVCSSHHIMVNGEKMLPNTWVRAMRHAKAVHSLRHLFHNGEKLCDIYDRVYRDDVPPPAAAGGELRYCSVAGADAVARLNDDGSITVLAGSRICGETKASCPPSLVAMRAAFLEESGLVLPRDVVFSSRSYAAGFVAGSSLGGTKYWKTEKKLPTPRRKKA